MSQAEAWVCATCKQSTVLDKYNLARKSPRYDGLIGESLQHLNIMDLFGENFLGTPRKKALNPRLLLAFRIFPWRYNLMRYFVDRIALNFTPSHWIIGHLGHSRKISQVFTSNYQSTTHHSYSQLVQLLINPLWSVTMTHGYIALWQWLVQLACLIGPIH